MRISDWSSDVCSSDLLQDLVDRINNANTGAEATGVTASIVRVSASESYMALTVDKAGESLGTEVALADPDGVLGQLGVLVGGAFANEFQAARKAQFYAHGILDPVTKQPLVLQRTRNQVTHILARVPPPLSPAQPAHTGTTT